MTDRPTAPDPRGDPPEGTTPPGTPEPTAPLPPVRQDDQQVPAGHAASGGGAGPHPAPQQPSTPRRLWGEATATTGATIALVTAGVLALVVFLAGVGLVGSWVAHRVDLVGLAQDDDDDAGHGPKGWGRDDDRRGDTPHGNNGRGNGNGNGRADGQGDKPGKGQGRGRGNGASELGGLNSGGLPGLGAVLHGEFTTSITGSPTVMVFQTGEVSAYTEDESIEVTSSDGFEATYEIDPTTAVRGTPVEGDQVRVVAAKDGMTAVIVQGVGPGD